MFSSSCEIISSVPHIAEQLEKAFSGFPVKVELDGELYYHGMDFEDIHSIVSRTKNFHPDFEMIEFHVFDCIFENSESMPQGKRTLNLEELFKKTITVSLCPDVKLVKSSLVDSEMELYSKLDDYLGYEGFIVRDVLSPYIRRRNTMMMKFKPRKKDVYKVVGTQEEISIEGIPKNSLGALLCQTLYEKQTFAVGSGPFLTREKRQKLWSIRDTLVGCTAVVKYQTLTSGRRVPRHGILIDLLSPAGIHL